MNVLIVDDHTIIRRGVRNLISNRYPASIFSDCTSVREVEMHLSRSAPDLIVLDLVLNDGNAFDRLGQWVKQHPGTSILIYSMVPEHLYAGRVAGLGCAGFVSKRCTEETLLEALDRVVRGLRYFSRPDYANETAADGAPLDNGPFRGLSDREVRVMQDLLADLGVKDISMRMGISPSTVATYKARLFDKLGVSSVMELRRMAELYQITA